MTKTEFFEIKKRIKVAVGNLTALELYAHSKITWDQCHALLLAIGMEEASSIHGLGEWISSNKNLAKCTGSNGLLAVYSDMDNIIYEGLIEWDETSEAFFDEEYNRELKPIINSIREVIF